MRPKLAENVAFVGIFKFTHKFAFFRFTYNNFVRKRKFCTPEMHMDA